MTELWAPDAPLDGTHVWDSDGGIATYNPVVYETQRIYLPGHSQGSFRLKYDQSPLFPGKRDQVCAAFFQVRGLPPSLFWAGLD